MSKIRTKPMKTEQGGLREFKPHQWQIPPWKDTSPVMLLTGSAGGGKSRLAAEKVHAFLLTYPGATGLILRKVRATMANSTLLFLKRKIMGNDPNIIHRPSDFRFEYANGSILAYGGMKDDEQREHIRSIGQDGGVDIVWMEEASQFQEQDFNEVLARMRSTAAPWRQIILSTNPDSPGHWINIRLILGEEASVYYSSASDNAANPEAYFQSLNKLTGVQRARLVQGLWVVGSGQIFDTWMDAYDTRNDNDHGGSISLRAEYQPGLPVIWSIDDGYSGEQDKKTGMFTGKSHPRVILMAQRQATGQITVFAESYKIKSLAVQHFEEVKETCEAMGWNPPYLIIRDRAAASLDSALKEVGLAKEAKFNRVPVDESIKELRYKLAPDAEGYRGVLVHPRCTHLRYEMASFSYDMNGGIIKEQDNGPDALRYLIWHETYGKNQVDVANWRTVAQMNLQNNGKPGYNGVDIVTIGSVRRAV